MSLFDKNKIKERYRARKERRALILQKREESRFHQKMIPVCAWMNRFSIPLTILLAGAINILIEAISRHSFFQACSYLVGSPLVFLYNTYLIFIPFCLAYCFRRRIFTRILVAFVWILLGVINGALLLKRVTPFNAQDLKAISEAASVATRYFSVLELVLVLIGILAVVIWLISFWRRGRQFKGKLHRAAAIALCLVLAISVPFVTKFATNKRVLSSYFGNIAFAYQDYGLPYCFMTSLFNTGIDQPEGYTEEAMEKIKKDAKTDTIKNDGVQLKSGETVYPNIIVIQWESFFDTDEISWLHPSEDPLPNFHKLEKKYSAGYFKAPSVGAGTANTEFEVLTGMNMRSFGPGEYPFKTILKQTTCESVATALDNVGYTSFAFHNNGGNFYSRADVYNNIGFDAFVSKEFMNILQYTENGWAKDFILPQYMLQAMNSTEGRDFLFAITVQCHGDYSEEKVIEDPKITLDDLTDEGLRNKWEYYLNQMYETDQMIGELLEELEKRDEPTMVFIYGDHLPTIDLTEEDMKSKYLYNTNYVLWDNMGLEKDDQNLAAYQVVSEITNRAGIHSGTTFNYHQKRRGTKNYLADLELLQYDMLYGEHYLYEDGTLPLTEGHMVMGLNDVTIERIQKQTKKSYSIYGQSFTQNSCVYINGEKHSTIFLNNTRLDFSNKELEDGDEIKVCQVGSKSRVFRESKTFVYQNGKLMEKAKED